MSLVSVAVADDAIEAASSGDCKKAYQLWSVDASKGNPSAQYNLGLMYFSGQGAPQDYKEAAKWYRKAAEQGDANTQTTLGFMYVKGNGVLQNYEEAYAWWVVAAANGNETARSNMENVQDKMTANQIERGQKKAKEIWARLDN